MWSVLSLIRSHGIHPDRRPYHDAIAVRDLCEREVRPHVMDWDEAQHFPPRNSSPIISALRVCSVCSFQRSMADQDFGYNEYVETIVEVAHLREYRPQRGGAQQPLHRSHQLLRQPRTEEEMAHQTCHRRMAGCVGIDRTGHGKRCHAHEMHGPQGREGVGVERHQVLDHTRQEQRYRGGHRAYRGDLLDSKA